MLQLFISQCDGVSRLVAVACANAAIPSVFAVAVALLVTRLKIWNSATRYWAWWLTLAFLVLLPMLLVALRPPARAYRAVLAPVRTMHMQSVASDETPKLETIAPSSHAPPVSERSYPPIPALLLIIYCGFVFWRLSLVALGFWSGMRLKRRAEVFPDAAVRFGALIPALRMRRRVSLATSDRISAPVAIGYWAPCILLPRKLLGQLDDTELEQVIAHELAHIGRYDDWWIAVQKLVESLFVFHPLVHLLSRRIDLDREMACDDHVISSYQPRAYAACLTKIAELVEFGAATALTVPLLARKSHLASRVEMMLDRTRAHIPSISARRLAVFAMFGLLAVCLSLRTPALFAFPALSYSYAAWMPEIAVKGVQVAPNPPQPAEPPSPVTVAPVPPVAALPPPTPPTKRATTESGGIDSIAVTSDNGASTTFEENGNERTNHSPFPRGTIVFERNGNSYIIRDHPTLAAAQELLKSQKFLSRQQEALSSQQEKLSEAQEKLSQQQEALSNRALDHATASDFEKQLRNLEEKIRSIDVEKSLKTASDAQERISELQSMLGDIQSRMGEQQSKTGNKQGELGEQQSLLGEQQSLLGEQQSRLGDQQSKLGEQQEREARRAEQKLRDLIQDAERRGLARPLQ